MANRGAQLSILSAKISQIENAYMMEIMYANGTEKKIALETQDELRELLGEIVPQLSRGSKK